MTSTSTGTAVGVFPTRKQAQRAVQELKQMGFRDDQIGVAGRNDTVQEGLEEAEGNMAAEGALAGVAAGAGVGGLWALGVAGGFLPAIGPVIAGGVLASLLASAAAGAATGGLVGLLIGLGIPEEEAEYYHSEFEAGRTIVTVNAGDRREEALRIFRRYGGNDASTRSTTDVLQVPVTRDEVVVERHPAHTASGTGEEIRVPVREEQVQMEKAPLVTDRNTVGKRPVQETKRVPGDDNR